MKESKERAIISASEMEIPSKSSRGYYRAQGQVPFEWESEPGKPKNPAGADVEWVPPPSPSPAMQSARLTREKKKQKKREEKLQLSRHGSGSSLTPIEGCFLNPVRLMVYRTVKKWDLVPFFRAD